MDVADGVGVGAAEASRLEAEDCLDVFGPGCAAGDRLPLVRPDPRCLLRDPEARFAGRRAMPPSQASENPSTMKIKAMQISVPDAFTVNAGSTNT